VSLTALSSYVEDRSQDQLQGEQKKRKNLGNRARLGEEKLSQGVGKKRDWRPTSPFKTAEDPRGDGRWQRDLNEPKAEGEDPREDKA